MKKSEQNIEIAKYCGWKIIYDSAGPHNIPPGWEIGDYIANGEPKFEIPDYVNDLNMMHSAETILIDNDEYWCNSKESGYLDYIIKFCGNLRDHAPAGIRDRKSVV